MNELIGLLKHQPKNSRISGLISALEAESTVDLATSADSLEGVWELRWSSATQPWLQQVTRSFGFFARTRRAAYSGGIPETAA